MMHNWHSTSKTSSRVVLLALWLPIIPWCVSASEDGNISGGDDGSNESAPNISSVYLDRSSEDFNIELNFLRWGTCQKPEPGKPLKCCENDLNTDDDRRYYACEELYLSDAAKMVQARFEVGDLQRSLMSRYMSEVNSFFNVSENPAWAEIATTPIGDIGDIPFNYFLGRPIQNIFSRALNHSLEQTLNPDIDRRRIERRLEELRSAINTALNHTLNDLVNESLDYVFALDDQDFNFVSGQWFRLRNLSLESIFDAVLQGNTGNMTGVESLLRIAWRLFLNQQQESLERFLSNPGDVVAWVFNTYMSIFNSNRTSLFNTDAFRGFVQYFSSTDSYQVTIPLCYTPMPASSLCWNIHFLINTNQWTIKKTVKLSVESNLLAADSFIFELFDMDLNGTGFRDQRHEGVCMSGKISLLDMPDYPVPKFEVNCHPVFYRPMQYVDQALCLLYERTTRTPERNSSIGKVCVDPVQSTLAHEVVRNFIRVTVNTNNLEPQNNKVCRNLIHQLHASGTGTGRDEFMTRAIVEMVSMSITNVLGVRSDRRTISQIVRLARALPIVMDTYGALSQVSNSTEMFNRNLMECGVLLLQHGEQHRAMALRPMPPGRLATPQRGIFGRELPRWRQPSDHRLGPPPSRLSPDAILERLIPDRSGRRRARRSEDFSKGDAPRGDFSKGEFPSEDFSKRSVREDSSKVKPASEPGGLKQDLPHRTPTGRKLLQYDEAGGEVEHKALQEEAQGGYGERNPYRDETMDDIPTMKELQGQQPNPSASLNTALATLFSQMDELRFRLRDFLDGQRVNFQSRFDNYWDRYMTRFRIWLQGFLARVLGRVTQYAPAITRHP